MSYFKAKMDHIRIPPRPRRSRIRPWRHGLSAARPWQFVKYVKIYRFFAMLFALYSWKSLLSSFGSAARNNVNKDIGIFLYI